MTHTNNSHDPTNLVWDGGWGGLANILLLLEHFHLPRVRDIAKHSECVEHFLFEDCAVARPEITNLLSSFFEIKRRQFYLS